MAFAGASPSFLPCIRNTQAAIAVTSVNKAIAQSLLANTRCCKPCPLRQAVSGFHHIHFTRYRKRRFVAEALESRKTNTDGNHLSSSAIPEAFETLDKETEQGQVCLKDRRQAGRVSSEDDLHVGGGKPPPGWQGQPLEEALMWPEGRVAEEATMQLQISGSNRINEGGIVEMAVDVEKEKEEIGVRATERIVDAEREEGAMAREKSVHDDRGEGRVAWMKEGRPLPGWEWQPLDGASFWSEGRGKDEEKGEAGPVDRDYENAEKVRGIEGKGREAENEKSAVWVERLRQLHSMLVVTAGLSCILYLHLSSIPSLGTQMAFLAVGVGLLGVPHGAYDLLVAEHLFQRTLSLVRKRAEQNLGVWQHVIKAAKAVATWHPLFRTAVFMLGYALCSLAVVMTWHFFPGPSLAATMVGSAWHFGSSDVRGHLAGPLHWCEIFGRGWAPIALPCFFHFDEVVLLFSCLAPHCAAVAVAQACACMAVPAITSLAASAAFLLTLTSDADSCKDQLPTHFLLDKNTTDNSPQTSTESQTGKANIQSASSISMDLHQETTLSFMECERGMEGRGGDFMEDGVTDSKGRMNAEGYEGEGFQVMGSGEGLGFGLVRQRSICYALEMGVLLLNSAIAPPLMAFGISFCLLHSLRHTLEVLASLGPLKKLPQECQNNQGHPSPECLRIAAKNILRWSIRHAGPMTALTLACAITSFILLIKGFEGTWSDFANVAAGSKVIYIGLAALTLPHMALIELLRHLQQSNKHNLDSIT